MTADDLSRLLRDVKINPFMPSCIYSAESKSLTAYFKNDPDYSKQLTSQICLYLSMETNEIVGCRIEGVAGFIELEGELVAIAHVECDELKARRP